MGGEGGQVLGDGLLIPDIGQYPVKDLHPAVSRHRDVKAALGHQNQQSQCFQRHRLAAGVRAGDHQRVKVLPQTQVVPYGGIPVQQGVSCPLKMDAPLHDFGGHTPHTKRQPRPGKDTVQHHQKVIVLADVLPVGGAVAGKFGQNAVYLLLLQRFQLPQLIVGLHHPHRLHKEGAAAGRKVVDQAGHIVFMLRLHRHHIAAVALGDDGFLQVFGLIGGDDALQNIPDLAGRGPFPAADVGQFGAGGVGDLLLRENGAGDLLLQKAVGGQALKERVQGRFLLAFGGIFHGRAGASQHSGNIQKLPGVQCAPHIGPLEGGPHRLHPAKVGRPPQGHQFHGGRGLGQSPFHAVGIGHGPQLQSPVLPLLGHRLGRQQFQHPGQLQRGGGFFK